MLELTDGRGVFVKAVSAEQNPVSPDLARAEARVAPCLPQQVPAPRLQWSSDDGDWVILGFDVVHGRSPELPWQPDDLTAVLAAVSSTSRRPSRSPGTRCRAPTTCSPRTSRAGASSPRWTRRSRTAASRPAARSGRWARKNLDLLQRCEQESLRAVSGDGLVHGDLRADNVLIDPDHQRVWLIDWPHASVGAPWIDLAFMLPSVVLQGGGDPATIFRAQPSSEGVSDDELRAGLAGLAGYFVWSSLQPAPPGIPNLRRFQAAQGMATVRWFRELT